jgi:hypothetical protein
LLAEMFSGACRSSEWNYLRGSLEIIPSQSGKLVAADDAIIAPAGTTVPGKEVVAVELQEQPFVRRLPLVRND